MKTFGEKVIRAPCAESRRRAASAMRSASGASMSAVGSFASIGGSLFLAGGGRVNQPEHSPRRHVRGRDVIMGPHARERVALVVAGDGEHREGGHRDRRKGERQKQMG